MSGQDTNETSPLLEEQNPLKGSEDLSGEERRKIANKRFVGWTLVGCAVLVILVTVVPLLASLETPSPMSVGT